MSGGRVTVGESGLLLILGVKLSQPRRWVWLRRP